MSELNPDHRKKRISVSRVRCDELLRLLVERAREVNDGDVYSYIVARLTVFGSYLSKKEKLGDLDVAVDLKQRYGRTNAQTQADNRRRSERTTRPRDMVDEAFWPQIEVKQFLRGRSTAISLHEMWELEVLCKEFPETRFKVIFEDLKYSARDVTAEAFQGDGE